MGSWANDYDRAGRLARERGRRLAKERRPIVAGQKGGEEISDDEIEAIHEQAAEAAIHGWGPAGTNREPNPHPQGSRRAEIYDYAYRNAYARQNGY